MALIGIDEVGRGCWAGPMVVVGVRLDENKLAGLKDSKALTKKKRLILRKDICQQAFDIKIVWVAASYIDAHGLTKSMQKACQTIVSSLSNSKDSIIIDGTVNFLKDVEGVTCMRKADELIPAVAAASIIAKVARDSYMEKLDVIYPQYGFSQHVGYGTKNHIDALEKYGVSTIHRASYKPIAKYL